MANLVQDHLACLQKTQKPQGDHVTYWAHSDNRHSLWVWPTMYCWFHIGTTVVGNTPGNEEATDQRLLVQRKSSYHGVAFPESKQFCTVLLQWNITFESVREKLLCSFHIMELKPFEPLQLLKRHIKTPTSLGLLEQIFSRDGWISHKSHFMVTLLSSLRAARCNVREELNILFWLEAICSSLYMHHMTSCWGS